MSSWSHSRKNIPCCKLSNHCNFQSFSLKLHKSFENLKAFYYFDMIRQGVLQLCALYTTLLEPKLPNLTWKRID